MSQEQVASVLGVDRSLISLYENGEREISLTSLEKLSDLFGVELEELLEDSADNRAINAAFAFRSEGLSDNDLGHIAEFRKVVKYYMRMKEIEHETKQQSATI